MSPATPEISGFRIEGLTGRGGMGTVYRATQISLERTVALKVVQPHLAEDAEFRERFRSEMRLAAKLDHPNLVTVYEAGESNGHLFIAMQHIEGENLAERLARTGPLHPGEAVSVLKQVSLALDELHREGIVHRDVKPGNILLDEGRDRAYLSDFGIAKSLEATRGFTATGYGIGALRFISPEQARNRQVDGRSDVYSLGCAFFEAIAGGSPYGDDESDASILLAKVNDEVQLPSEVRPELGTSFDEIARRAMALDPEDRFSTAGDFATAAREAASGEAITRPVALSAADEEPTRPLAAEAKDGTRKLDGVARDRRPPWVPIAALTLAVVLGGLGTFAALGGFSSSAEDPVAAATEPTEETDAPSREVDDPPRPAGDEAGSAPEAELSPAEAETVLTPVTRELYTASVPLRWVPDEIDERNEARHTSRWLNPDDERVFVLIDAQMPAPDLSPIESAASVRQQTSQTSGYSEIAFEEVEIGGRAMARWVFDLPDDRRIDYFFSECDVGVAVLGAAPASSFNDFEPTFESVAASVSARC